MLDPVIIDNLVEASYLIAKGLKSKRTLKDDKFVWVFEDTEPFRAAIAEIRQQPNPHEIYFMIKFANVFYRERTRSRNLNRSLGLNR